MKEDRGRLRILYDHGADPSIGRKPIAPVELLGDDPRGGFYGGYLFPVDYALQLVPALRAGQLGSSFGFAVIRETMLQRPGKSAGNPEGLPERRIREARLVELGPTPFPVYAGTTAGARSASATTRP
jgi:phage head maturation protease